MKFRGNELSEWGRAMAMGASGRWLVALLAAAALAGVARGARADKNLIGWQGESHTVDPGTTPDDKGHEQQGTDLHESIVQRKFVMPDRRKRPKPSHHASSSRAVPSFRLGSRASLRGRTTLAYSFPS